MADEYEFSKLSLMSGIKAMNRQNTKCPAFTNLLTVTGHYRPTHKTAKKEMEKSKSIAGIVGPTLIVVALSEMKLWNPTLYDTQIVPLIYLNGVLLFIAGLAIVRSRNIWTYSWQTLVTIVGYVGISVGIFRMFFPRVQQSEFRNDTSVLIVEAILILIGAFLTFKAYIRTKQ